LGIFIILLHVVLVYMYIDFPSGNMFGKKLLKHYECDLMKFWVKLGIAASKNVYSQILFVKLPENGILVFFHLILHILCSLKHLNKSWCESIQFDSEVEWCYRSR